MRWMTGFAGLSAALLSLAAFSAHATNLVTNGSFETTTLHDSGKVTNSNLSGWKTTSGYTFLVFPGDGTTNIGNGVALYGDSSGTIPNSPDGFNYIASDGAYETGTLTQTIKNLVVGKQYEISFWQAGAQQQGFNGATTDQWKVSLGNDVQYSDLISNVSHGFVDWQKQSLIFTATATSEVLGFMAVGTPSGVPPFSLLDGVSMNQYTAPVPEPSTMALSLLGIAGIAAARARRRRMLAADTQSA